MALSRWSHSHHYIYEPCGSGDDGEERCLQVCLFGHFPVSTILNSYEVIEARAKDDGYDFISRLELKLYLKSWALFVTKHIDIKKHVRHLEILRAYGIVKRYVQDPWDQEFDRMMMFYFRKFWKWQRRGF